jgi:ribosomal protein L32
VPVDDGSPPGAPGGRKNDKTAAMANLVKCPSCGHANLPNYPTCSQCGAALSPGGTASLGAGGPDDEYQRLLRSRAAAAKRNRLVFSVVAVVAVVVVGGLMWKDRQKKAAIQQKLNFVEEWLAIDKRETGSFWNCVTQSQTPVDNFANADQVQMKIESAYLTAPKTFAETMNTECTSKLERAQDAAKGMVDVPVEFQDALTKYTETLGKLKSGLDDYVVRLGQRGSMKDVDQLIQSTGDVWHSSSDPVPESIAFEKFLHCAVPGLAKRKDAQGLLEFLAEECFKKDATAFMDRVRADCGKFLTTIEPGAKPAASYKATMKAFFEDERRMMSAWEDCAKKSRKGKKSSDLEQFLHATAEHLESRTTFGKVGREIRDSN